MQSNGGSKIVLKKKIIIANVASVIIGILSQLLIFIPTIKNVYWRYISNDNYSNSFEFISMLLICAFAGTIIGIIFAIIMTVFTAKSISEPVKELTTATNDISSGNYDIRIDNKYEDELGDLANSFNKMADAIDKAMKEINDKNSQLSAIFYGMDDGVLAIDKDKNLLFLNNRVKELLANYDLEPGINLKKEHNMYQISKAISRVIDTGNIQRETIVLDNPKRVMNLYAAEIEANGAKGVVVVLTDITELDKLQKIQEDFAANVTHELKTPLTSIKGFVELLKSEDRDEQTRAYFYDVLEAETNRLTKLINDMLALSQADAIGPNNVMDQCDSEYEIEKVIQRIKPMAEENNISLESNLKENVVIRMPESRANQVFTNLIENAIKYNKPEGKVEINLTSDKNVAIIEVKDTGIGIPADKINRIFERFYRVDKSRSREVGGTGLGLSIVKSLVEIYRGTVKVDSIYGAGTKFTVKLPLVRR